MKIPNREAKNTASAGAVCKLSAVIAVVIALSICVSSCGKKLDNGPLGPSADSGKVLIPVGTNGGTVTVLSPSGPISVSVPSGALSSPVSITIMPKDKTDVPMPDNTMFLAAASFGPNGTVFNKPVTVTFTLNPAKTPGSTIALLVMDETTKYWELCRGFDG